MYNNLFFYRTVYEKIWKNIVEPYTPQVTAWRMRIACWITKSKNTHSECVHCNNGCTKAPQCYVTYTLPVLLPLSTVCVIPVSVKTTQHTLHLHSYGTCAWALL